MKHVKKSVLLWYSAREMYELVIGVQSYPHFLPWCERSDVLTTHDDGVTVCLHLAYSGLRLAFTTRNVQVDQRSVVMSLVDGPFSALDGTWLFTPIGPEGSTPACRVDFDLRYAISSRPLELVLSPVFDRVANTFVDSFVQRAEQVYGQR